MSVKPAPKRMRIADIAKLAGVSPSAVSAALNDRPQIAESTRRHILEVMRGARYTPLASARALSGRRSRQIGFLFSNATPHGVINPYFGLMMSGALEVCAARDHQLLVCGADLYNDARFELPACVRQNTIDGLLVAGIIGPATLRKLREAGPPFIVIDGRYDDDVLFLEVDVGQTLDRILRHMRRIGHRLVRVYYDFPRTLEIFEELRRNFAARSGMDDFRLEAAHVGGGDQYGFGESQADRWLEQPAGERYTAFIANHQIAQGFLHRATPKGVRCPRDISIVVSDDNPYVRNTVLPLAAIGGDNSALGRLATNLLIDLVENRKSFMEVKSALTAAWQAPSFEMRDSLGPPPEFGQYLGRSRRRAALSVAAAAECRQ